MSITGALLGFACISILVGIVGSIVTGIMWGESKPWDEGDPHRFKKQMIFFVAMVFIGGILVGGLG